MSHVVHCHLHTCANALAGRDATRCTSLGAGPRVRKIAFVAVKVRGQLCWLRRQPCARRQPHQDEQGLPSVAERQRDKQPLPGAPQVYAITLYVDEAAAKPALAGHSGDEAVCEAVKEGAFTKALQVHS